MSIWITGDTHMPIDVKKITSKYWPEGKELTKNDYLIVCGDFGLVWSNILNGEEQYWTNWLNEKPWTTLFVDGNHENHNRLARLKKVEMFNSLVGKVTDSIFHLKRGQVYIIEELKFFCMGGALSVDKVHRTLDMDWWKEEQPSHYEMDVGLTNLEKYNNEVDYIISHTLPQNIKNKFYETTYEGHIYYDNTCKYLQHIYDTVEFKKGYCGHWHDDKDVDKYRVLYEDVIQIN